jgi:membrane protease subunit HflK
MAWNDPGKNGNPWQRRPEKGPPDLDELLRRLQRRLRGLFGGSGGGAGGDAPSGGGRGRAIGLSSIGAALVALWVLFGSFYLNGAAERSVITRFGKYVKTTAGGFNMRLPWPIDRRTVINVTEFKSFSDRTRMLTQDEALVDLNYAVQYRRADPVKFAFNVREPEETLGEVSESAIREVVGQSKLSAVLGAGRQEIGAKTKDLVQRTITAYNTGLEVISVNLQEVAVPEQVAPAQKDASKAVQDKERAILAAQTYANDIVPKARGAAVSVVEGARAYRSRVIADADGETARFLAIAAEYQRAPAVTRERLYLETMEQVLGSATKVLVDVEGTGNMLYLPLDKLLEQRLPRGVVDTPPTIRMEDGSAIDAEDPRARKER